MRRSRALGCAIWRVWAAPPDGCRRSRPPAGVRFPPPGRHRCCRHRRRPVDEPQSSQLAPRDGRSHGINHLGDAVVIAAGEGRRLRPLTERWPKPVLPVDGRPVIASLAREMAAAGFTRLTVVTGHLAEQVESLLGDGGAFGLELHYARQPSPDGSADAVRCALAAGARPPLLVAAADTLFVPGHVRRFVDAFEAPGA